MELVLGQSKAERRLGAVEDLLAGYLTDDGLRYLDYCPITPANRLVPEDLAVTILVNSRVGPAAFKSIQDHGASLDLASLPDKPLEQTTEAERQAVADLIGQMVSWQGLATSVTTKVLHKKRPDLIPILDNQAIFGAYMNPLWPEQRSFSFSIYKVVTIKEALDWVAADLTRPENASVWPQLRAIQPKRTLIEIFDMIWWTHFRALEPVKPVQAI